MTHLRVELLGGFRVIVGGRTVPVEEWRQRKPAAVVKLLALAPGHRLHRDQVMDVLWPDLDPIREDRHAPQRLVAGRSFTEEEEDGSSNRRYGT